MGIGTGRKLNLVLIPTNRVKRRLRAAENVGQKTIFVSPLLYAGQLW